MASAYYVTQKLGLHSDIISYSGDVFACTLLHLKLRDYSLGQIVLLFFGCMENPESQNSPDQPEPTYFRELTHVHIIIA